MTKFQYGETTIFYESNGSGIPIIFIHPPAMGKVVFQLQKELGRYFHVIMPDLSGNGDSYGPEKKVTILSYAQEIKALQDHLKVDKAVICGYSAGGSVAQEFALKYPERTLGVILISGYAAVQSTGFKYEHLVGMYLVNKNPIFLSKIIASSHTHDKKYRNEILNHMKKANRNMWFQFYEQSLHYSCLERLPQMSVPILLMYGSRDFSNQHIRAYRKTMSHQEVILKNVSHQLPTKRSQEVNQHITEFIFKQIKPRIEN